MFKVLIDFIFWLLAKIAEIIFTPITDILTGLFPDLGTLITNIQSFLSTYIFPTLQWTKMFCINTLAFPSELLNFLTSVFSIMVSLYLSMLLYKGILTLYQKLKP